MGSHDGGGSAEVAAGSAAIAGNAVGGDTAPSPDHRVRIGDALLPGLPHGPAGTPFRIGFHLTGTGLLHVRGRDPASGRATGFDGRIGGTGRAGAERAEEAVAMIRASG
ncbi:hypothetical protein GCM10009551_025560 [Nocardiopsis tropica]|uniref:hypothetical protein n=1 Tax=Nocardiopsis tropica TaxID=109330 RepID=UPI0031E34C2A